MGSHHTSRLGSATAKCAVTGKEFPLHELIAVGALRPRVAALLRVTNPGLDDSALVSMGVANNARLEYVREALESQIGDLTRIDEEVLQSLASHEVMAERPSSGFEERARRTVGERLSDRMAEFGGSWTFILCFGALLVGWIVLNVVWYANRGFDPYPFILLNLLLSCLAALQAPVIMMSQRRQETRDRARAENDYQVNLKAELEIRHLHEKVDYLLHQYSTRLMEIQHLQLEAIRELGRPKD